MKGIKGIRMIILLVFIFLLAGAAVASRTQTLQEKTVSVAYQELPEIHLMIATDLHYLSPALTDHGTYFMELIEHSDGKTMEYSEELAEAFTDTVIKQKPDALILTGDLTFNGAKKSHEDLTEKLRKIEEAGIPVLVLSGNHDLDNRNAASFSKDRYELVESISGAEFEKMYGPFGFDDAYSRDVASSSYTWEFASGLWLLMLDVNGVRELGHVPEETLQWMETQLKDAQEHGSRVIAFSHQNLLKHSMFEAGYMIENSEDVLGLYRKYGVLANFTGHLHIQHIEEQDGFYEAATSALSVSPNQYADIVLKEGELLYETSPVMVAAWAKENHCTSKKLQEFDIYAKEFFLASSYEQAEAQLYDLQDEEKKEEMAEYFAEENYAYFSGHLERTEQRIEMLDAWKKSGSFIGGYLDSISGEIRENQNIMKIICPFVINQL